MEKKEEFLRDYKLNCSFLFKSNSLRESLDGRSFQSPSPITITPFMISHCETLFENLISEDKPVSARPDRFVYKKPERHRVFHIIDEMKMLDASNAGGTEELCFPFNVFVESCFLLKKSFKQQNGSLSVLNQRNI